MSDSVKFVDFAWSTSGGAAGNTFLDINDSVKYCIDEIEFAPAKPRFEFRDPSHGDGRDVSRYKHENREVKLTLHVFGTSEADLYENARALWAQLMADAPILEWIPTLAADPLYIDLISPPTQIDPSRWFETWIRDNNLYVIPSIVLSLEAKPFLRAPEESLEILYGLGPNDSFERRTVNDLDNWLETVVASGTVTADTTNFLDGPVGCKLTTTGAGDSAYITGDDYLLVNENHHFALQCYCYRVSGAPTLDVDLVCYNDVGAVLGTLYPLVAYAGIATTWIEAMEVGGSVVINPSSFSSAMKFPVGTTKVKRVIRQDAAAAGVMTVDKLWFGDTEYIAGYKPNGAVGIVVPPEDTLGDVPALADLYFTSSSNPTPSGVAWTSQTSGTTYSFNAVSALDATHVWAVGDSGTEQFFNGTSWADQHPMNFELLANPGLESWFGVPPSPSNWSFLGGSRANQEGNDHQHSGNYCWAALLDAGHPYGQRIILAPVAVPAKPGCVYDLSIYFCGNSSQYAGFLYAFFYDANGTPLLETSVDSNWAYGMYQQLSGTATAPADTVAIELRLYLNANDGSNRDEFLTYVDDASIKEVAGPDFLAVSAFDATHVWAVGIGGEIEFSANGSTWVSQASGHTHALYGVAAVSASSVYAVGVGGCIAHFNGSAWSHVYVGSQNFRAIYAFDSTHIWAVGDNGIIYFFNGTTWTRQTSGTTLGLGGVHSFDSTHIWAVGNTGKILFSADAGVTWTPQTSGTTKNLWSVYAADATHVWAVGVAGVILFFNGISWTSQNSYTVETLGGVEGISATSAWAVGDIGTIRHLAVVPNTGVPFTNLIAGQRPTFSPDYDPVKDAVGATLTNLYTRRNQKYRSMAVGAGTLTEDFSFNIASHEGRYLVSASMGFAVDTADAKANAIVNYKLQTLGGTDITTDIQTDSVFAGDQTTYAAKFREVALNPWSSLARWAVKTFPSFQIGDSASKGNISQVVQISQGAADDQAEWLDYCAIIPIDSYVEIDDWTASAMILDSSMGLVLASLDGSQDTAQVFPRSKVKGLPQFHANPNGINMTLIQITEVTNDQRANSFCNIVMRYSPLYILVPEG